jgi:pyruvate kinase
MKELILTKIIATLGPASNSSETIKSLISAGVRIFRINFSHGNIESFSALVDLVRKASKETDTPVAILGDLSGPKIRIGQISEPGIELTEKSMVEILSKEITGHLAEKNVVVISTTYPEITKEVTVGQRIMIDDGNLTLQCVDKTGDRLICKVLQGGLITSKKGINLPETSLSAPTLTEWDLECLHFAVNKRLDYLALSFVRKAADIILLKNHLMEMGARPFDTMLYGNQELAATLDSGMLFIPVISKIEKPQALEDLNNIVTETDIIMIARGDLGVEMDLAEVAVLQKKILKTCHDHGVPVIVATQMLQSMIETPNPTRAEVSDVANAIYDGVDAVMLSGETAVGKWPVKTVRIMNRIARLTNRHILEENISHQVPKLLQESKFRSAALASGVKSIVTDIDARLIVVWTKFGGGALHLSQLNIPRPIVAFSDIPETLNRMALLYGIYPEEMEQPVDSASFIRSASSVILEKDWGVKGDAVVFVFGEPILESGATNSVYIHYL